MKVIFSPCLYAIDNKELFELFGLNDTLDFIVNNLEACLDDYSEVFYNDNRLYTPPVSNTNTYLQYISIMTNIFKLKANGETISLDSHNNEYELSDTTFKISNDKEFQNIIDYLYQLYFDNKIDDVLMFYGQYNKSYNEKTLKILIDSITFLIPVVGEPLLDKTGNFDKYLKKSKSNDDYNELFKYKNICCQLVDEMENQKSPGLRNGTLFLNYGTIIALRNKFSIYYPKKPYNKDTTYFISDDKKNIISIDLKHGHFEVFDNKNRQLWVAKYNMNGEEIDRPTDSETLKKIRETHKVEE